MKNLNNLIFEDISASHNSLYLGDYRMAYYDLEYLSHNNSMLLYFKANNEAPCKVKIVNCDESMFFIEPTKVIFNPPATIVWFGKTKVVVKCQDNEPFDPEKGLAMAIAKYHLGNKGKYFDIIKKWTKDYEKQHETPQEVKSAEDISREIIEPETEDEYLAQSLLRDRDISDGYKIEWIRKGGK